jgi:hypothetical protein
MGEGSDEKALNLCLRLREVERPDWSKCGLMHEQSPFVPQDESHAA